MLNENSHEKSPESEPSPHGFASRVAEEYLLAGEDPNEYSRAGMRIRRARDRGVTNLGWLTSRHSFSFGDYYDPRNMGFRSLRVINDDWIVPGKGFGTHGHRDMEIITLVLVGELEHQDSLGHREILRPGEVQVMSAGTGIRHSEVNPSSVNPAHFLQIWIEPHTLGIAPRYERRSFSLDDCDNSWCCLAGPGTRTDGSSEIAQNAVVSFGVARKGRILSHAVGEGEAAWLHIVEGELRVNGANVKTGDAVSVESPRELQCVGTSENSSVLLFAFSR